MPFGKVILFKMWKNKREQGIYRVLGPSFKKRKRKKSERLCRKTVEAHIEFFRVCILNNSVVKF